MPFVGLTRIPPEEDNLLDEFGVYQVSRLWSMLSRCWYLTISIPGATCRTITLRNEISLIQHESPGIPQRTEVLGERPVTSCRDVVATTAIWRLDGNKNTNGTKPKCCVTQRNSLTLFGELNADVISRRVNQLLRRSWGNYQTTHVVALVRTGVGACLIARQSGSVFQFCCARGSSVMEGRTTE